MKLLDICKIANMDCPAHLSECEVAGISSDSREIGENFVFVCLEGTRTDGHGFIDEALKKKTHRSDQAPAAQWGMGSFGSAPRLRAHLFAEAEGVSPRASFPSFA